MLKFDLVVSGERRGHGWHSRGAPPGPVRFGFVTVPRLTAVRAAGVEEADASPDWFVAIVLFLGGPCWFGTSSKS